MRRLFYASLFFCVVTPVLATPLKQLQDEFKRQDFTQAAADGSKLLASQPDNVEARFLTALSFQHMQQMDKARLHYLQLITSHPELPEPKNNLALIYMKQGKYDEAIDLLVDSLNTHPAYATAWQNLKLLYQGLASEAYRKALSKENNPRSVMDKIQLTALSQLHDWKGPPTSPATETIKLAEAKSSRLAESGEQKKPPTTKTIPVVVARAQTNTRDITEPDPRPRPSVIQSLKDWASAWSEKRFDRYIQAYQADYNDGKKSHDDWVAFRRSRIVKPGRIKVELSQIDVVSLSGNHAVVDFNQKFTSASYRDKVRKRIHLTRFGENWKITKEKTLAVL